MYSLEDMGGHRKMGLDPVAIDAVLFDLDGTLMDTDDQLVETAALWLQRLGRPRVYGEARRILMAAETPVNRLMTALDAVGLDAPLVSVWEWLRSLRGAAEQPDYRMMEDVKEMLADLAQRYRLAIVTTRGREDAQAFLAQHDLGDTFEVVVTREDTWRLKPHPAPMRRAAERLGVAVERCVMVGDTTVDIRSARRAGAKAVAVLGGFGERRELEQAGADVLLDHISELSSHL